MTFSIEKSKLPSFNKQSFEVITVELYQRDSDSAWEINWRGDVIKSHANDPCWECDPLFMTISQREQLKDYIAANQAEIEEQAQENREADRADYEYAKYMEERWM
jgi:hypothetical protein